MTCQLTKIHLLIPLATIFLAACGSDSGTGSGAAQAETIYGLGECDASNEGVTKLVTSENQYYKCIDGNWEETEAPVHSSSSKKSAFAGSSSSNKAFPGLDTKSSASDSGKSSSSNVALVDPSTVVKGTMTDERDGQSYKTVQIGDQVWMAENLNYRYLGPTAELDSSSFCYDEDYVNCETYGRLYLWSAALDSAGIVEGNVANGCGHGKRCPLSGSVRGVCPEGWHLPSYYEIITLFSGVGGFSVAGKVLKSMTGWDLYSGKENTNAFGFSALPAGYRDENGVYSGEGGFVEFWSYSRDHGFLPYHACLDYFVDYAEFTLIQKPVGFSVRCLED